MSEEMINIDLKGLDLSSEEKNELEAGFKDYLMNFLQEKAKPVDGKVVALGPGWIGIEA